jgi:hypothetical protein
MTNSILERDYKSVVRATVFDSRVWYSWRFQHIPQQQTEATPHKTALAHDPLHPKDSQ